MELAFRKQSDQPQDFSGVRILITGAGHGIGAATAMRFAALGATLILLDADADAVGRLAGELGAEWHALDVANTAAIARLAIDIGAPDIVVNNAGIIVNAPLVDCSEEDVRRLVDVDLLAPIFIMRAFGPPMIARGSGVFVNVSSQLGFCGAPGRAVYGACKSAIAHLSASMAAEWGPHGIRVVGIAPGRIETRMTEVIRASIQQHEIQTTVPLGRFGRPDEIADAICFVASPRASYITGTTLVVDGGYLTL